MTHSILGFSIEFAKEIALESMLRGMVDTEALQATVDIMNHALFGTGDNDIALIKASKAYVLTTDMIEIEFVDEKTSSDSRVIDPIMKAKIDSFKWLGSATISGFGIILMGVSFYRPKIHHVQSAFIPLNRFDLN